MDRRGAAGALLALAACIACSAAAPTLNEHTSLDLYDDTLAGCYYNFQHYGEGDRIMTNEPCLNCTCHNRMLMCYLRVCPFTKPIGQDCTVEKRADQCCPIVTCPDVPVDLLTSTSTTSPAEYGATGIGKPDKYGCSINGKYFSEGSKVPPSPNKPCEHCYCIRNMTTCVMQECTLHVDGCTPIYHKDVCCPVRYSCDHLDDEILLLDDMTTTVRPTPGFLLTTTTSSPVTQITQDCVHDDKIFADGALIKTEKACEHCYCMKGDIVCVVQECGTPMENEGKNCTSLPPREGQCCPDTYICEGDEIVTESVELFTTEISQDELTTFTPPRRHGAEGSGYRNEPDNISYIATPPTEIESEGSGFEQKLDTPQDSNEMTSTTVTHEYVTTKIPVTEEVKPKKEKEITEEEPSIKPQEQQEQITTITEKEENAFTIEEEQKTPDEDHILNQVTTSISPLEYTELVTKSDTDEFISKTTQAEISLPEENKSTITFESGSKTEKTTDTAKHESSTTIGIEENYISITTSSTIFEESEGVTTDKQHDIASHVPEKETLHISEHSPSTSSTPFLEEVEKVTTETQEQHIVTDNISETEAFEPHKIASTVSIPEKEANEEIDTISGVNNLPDTESHEYIPIATSAPIGDESGKETTSQDSSITSDFNEEITNIPHKYTPTVTNSLLEDNEYITTESNKESYISNEIPIVSDAHKHISSTIGLDIISEDDKQTTEVVVHETVTDRIRKDDDSYQYTPTATSIMPMTEESSVTVTEENKKVISFATTETDRTITDKYISTATSTPYLDDHKTTSSDYGDVITDGKSKEGSTISDKDFSSTLEFSSSKPDEKISTELNKYETSTTKLEDEKSYELHKLHSTTVFSIEDEYITTTEYTGKDQEFITHETSQSATTSNENIPNASSTPFLEEIEKASPEISEDNISSTADEPSVHMPEKHLVNTETISTLDEEVTTMIESEDILDVTPPSNIIGVENLDSAVPEKTTQHEPLKHETTISSTIVTDEKQTHDIELMTTESQLYSTSSPDSITTKENQFTVTTEPTFRKEDNVVQPVTSLNGDITSSTPNVEITTIGQPHEIPTISDVPVYIDESHKPMSSQQPMVEITTETVTLDQNYHPTSVDESSIVSTTHTIDKIDLIETSTINLGENEIHEDSISSAGRIPGEGDCLLNGVTYRNESAIPSTNKCHSGCRCLSSIISCDRIICSPPPEYMDNCQPTYDSPESCCPTFVCDQVRETLPPLPYKHVTTPETPKQSIPIECHGDECEISEDKKQPTESSELCTAGSCSTHFDNQEETSKCGPQGCLESSRPSAHEVSSSEKTELCINGKCERPVHTQTPEGDVCEGDSCKSIPETLPNSLQQDSKSQEPSSIPCTGETCVTIQESTNIMSKPNDISIACTEQNDCAVNQDNIEQDCTDDSCRKKVTTSIEQKPLCSGANCEQNEFLPDEPTKDAHHGTYAPIVEQSTDTEATSVLSISPDIVTKPTKEIETDESLPNDEINKDTVTELPELVTSNEYLTVTEKDLENMFITESIEGSTGVPQRPLGESHTLHESKPTVMDEQKTQTELPSITVSEGTILTVGTTSTEISQDTANKEEETDIKINQPEDITKLQDQMIIPDLPLTEIEKETATPGIDIFTSMDTNTREPSKGEMTTTIIDTIEHDVSTAKPYEYSTFIPTGDEVASGSSTPPHISVTYASSSELSTITSSMDLVPSTEKNIEVTESEEILPSLNKQELTTVKFETDDYTTLINDLEREQVNTNTDSPYLHTSGYLEDAFDKNKPSPSPKPDAESYSTTSEELSVKHETTESVLNEKEYTDSVPTVTHVIDSDIHFTETEDSRSESPVSNTVEEKLSTEAPFAHVTEVEAYVTEDNEATLPTFVTHDKEIETHSPSDVTESDIHISKIDVPNTTLHPANIDNENEEVITPDSLLTDSGTRATASEEINTSLPIFITKEEDIATDNPIALVTEIVSQKDEIDVRPGTTSLYVTEPGYSVERKTTSNAGENDNIKTDATDSEITESVVFVTRIDEIGTTLPTTHININEKVETDTSSMYVTEAIQQATETEEIKTTLSTLITTEETMKVEYPYSHVTDREPFVSKTEEKESTSPEYITEQEKVYTETPTSQFTKVTVETAILDETKTTSPTPFTDEKVEGELPVTTVTEFKPHPDELTETKTIIPDTVTEERTTAVDETKTTSPTIIIPEQSVEETIPTSPLTESKEHYSTLDDIQVTVPTHITDLENIEDETELPISAVTELDLHENKLTTILSEPHIETTQSTYVTEPEAHLNVVDQTSILPTTIVSDKNIESQSISSYVTESGMLTTDNDIMKSTLSVTDSESEKLHSEAHTSHVTELGSQANDEKETKTTTLSSIIYDEATKTDAQSSYVTEPEAYVPEIDETKTTMTSSQSQIAHEETSTTEITQSALPETETKIPTIISEDKNTVSEFDASTEKDMSLQIDEGEEIKTIQPTSFVEEDKSTPISYVTESGDHTDKLDETKTISPVSATDKESIETETKYSQVTESLGHVTKLEETSTISSAPHLSEESDVNIELTPKPTSDSEDHATKAEETKTTAPELFITKEEKTESDIPVPYVTEAEIHGTVSDETSSSSYTPLPDLETHETKEPTYLSETEAYHTVHDEMKTTIPTFITVGENIKTEASADYATESIDLITPDIHKLSTVSEHIYSEPEVQTTEPSIVSEIGLEDKDSTTVEKEYDNVELTTKLYDSFTHIKPDATSTHSLTESSTEMKFVEEVKPSTESSKVESISSVSVSEYGTTQSDEFETKVPEADMINEIHPALSGTEGQQLSTEITESTSIEKDTSLHQDQYTKSPELLPVTTVVAVTESEKIDTASVIEDVQKPVTSSSDVMSEELDTQKEIVTEKQIISTELPAITVQHDLTESGVPVTAQEGLISSEPETPYAITLAPESLTTNLQQVSQTYPEGDHHIKEEEQIKIKPIIDYIDSSTIKSEVQEEMTTIPQEQYFTEKQETIPIEHDSSIVTPEITSQKPVYTEIDSVTKIHIHEESTEHEHIKHTFAPVAENTEILPDVIELEEHTHKTLLETTTVTSVDDHSITQSEPDKDDLENQTPEQSLHEASDEQHGIKESTVINENTSTTSYEVEKSTVAAIPVEETSEEILSINTTPASSEQKETSTYTSTQVSDRENVSTPVAVLATEKPSQEDKAEATIPADEITLTTLTPTSTIVEKESPAPVTATSVSETQPSNASLTKAPSATQPPEETSPLPEEEHVPPSGGSGYGSEPDYVEEDQAFGPGTCRYGGKVYVSAQQIPRDDPCDFCFCFRSDIICLQQSCPPPIHGCHEEPIQGFCCPRYECPVSMATTLNVTTTTTTTTTTLPPHFPTHSYKGAAQRKGCQIRGHSYKVGDVVRASSGPCLHCTCGGDGQMKCDPKACTPEPMLRQMIAAAVSAKRRR